MTRDQTLITYLKRPGVGIAALVGLLGDVLDLQDGDLDGQVLAQVEVEAKYEGYIARQEEEIARIRRHEGLKLDEGLDFAGIEGLSAELKQKLTEARPSTLARAARIPGMTAAGLSVLLVHARRARATGAVAAPEDEPARGSGG
jgi:tRNA uridine 5-carboxymethylaminomethyl modification enzyme